MDTFSQKQDNRKRFQDKQRLKHRHATPSDRKYRALKFQEAQKEKDAEKDNEEKPEEEVQPPSNDYRYHEDISMTFEDPAELERDLKAGKTIRDVLRAKEGQEDPLIASPSAKEAVTTRSLHSMALDDLNGLLGGRNGDSRREPNHHQARIAPAAKKSATKTVEKTATPTSKVPDELQSAQDFLDDLI